MNFGSLFFQKLFRRVLKVFVEVDCTTYSGRLFHGSVILCLNVDPRLLVLNLSFVSLNEWPRVLCEWFLLTL